jgi:hypothetical protein
MVNHEITFNGKLALLEFSADGRRAVSASGYRVPEAGEVRLYLVTLLEERLNPPQRLVHVALARFARELGATHLVPVDHGMAAVPGRVTAAALAGGLLPCLPRVSLEQLDAKLRR